MNRTFRVAALAACTVLACDGQVDSHYRGEPLMTLSGKVVASDSPLSSDLVPAFVFRQQETDWAKMTPVPEGTQSNFFLRGQVTGSFPNAFAMTLFDPPPAVVLKPFVKGEVKIAVADFVAIPRDHPAQLIGQGLPALNPMASSPEEPGANQRIRLCSESGDCIEREHHCPRGNGIAEAAFPCGPKLPDRPSWETRGYSVQHALLYAPEPIPAASYTARSFGDGAAIAAGYHLLAYDSPIDPDPNQSLELTPSQQECEVQRNRELDELARKAGAVGPRGEVVDFEASDDLWVRYRLDHPCSHDIKLKLADTSQSVNLTLTGTAWNPFLFFAP